MRTLEWYESFIKRVLAAIYYREGYTISATLEKEGYYYLADISGKNLHGDAFHKKLTVFHSSRFNQVTWIDNGDGYVISIPIG